MWNVALRSLARPALHNSKTRPRAVPPPANGQISPHPAPCSAPHMYRASSRHQPGLIPAVFSTNSLRPGGSIPSSSNCSKQNHQELSSVLFWLIGRHARQPPWHLPAVLFILSTKAPAEPALLIQWDVHHLYHHHQQKVVQELEAVEDEGLAKD